MMDLINKIKKAKDIAIISHVRPDGDTIGGALSMFELVKSLGKTAYLLCEDTPPEFFAFLNDVKQYSTTCPLTKVDLSFAIDCATKGRLGKFAYLFDKSKISVNIDHHAYNNGYGDINHLVGTAASTCQILFDLYKTENVAINNLMGKYLYTGMSTDTGHFMHNNVGAHNFLQAAEIASMGVDIASVTQSLYKEMRKNKLLLVARAINNMTWHHNDKICVINISDDDLNELGCELNQTEGLVNYAINLKDIMVGILITQNEHNGYKVSLRAKPPFNVAQCAADFGGGGHVLAAGCMLYGDIKTVNEQIIASVVSRF